MTNVKTKVPMFRRELQMIGALGDQAVYSEIRPSPGEETIDPELIKVHINQSSFDDVK